MHALINRALDFVWPDICKPQTLSTPARGAKQGVFLVISADQEEIRIRIKDTNMKIRRDQVFAALEYLVTHKHNVETPCKIGANNVYEKAGPLDRATRNSKEYMVIIYIVSILESAGLVAIDGKLPSKVWLA